MDDKIGAKELPRDLQRLATKVIESEQDVEKTVGKKLKKKVFAGSYAPSLLKRDFDKCLRLCTLQATTSACS